MRDSPLLFWCNMASLEEPFPLHAEQQHCAEYHGLPDESLTRILDTRAVSFPGSFLERGQNVDAWVQRILLDRLHPIDESHFLEGAQALRTRSDIEVYQSEAMTDELASSLAASLGIAPITAEAKEIQSESWQRELTWTSVLEHGKGGPAMVPESLALVGRPCSIVTAGWQTGLGKEVEHYERYWSRFLSWTRSLYALDGGSCGVDLSYVGQLCRYSSVLGFVQAARLTMPS